MPGSPPMSTSVPGTIPPPRTRSNSVTPDGMRTSSCDSISVNATAVTSRSLKPFRPAVFRAGCAFSSTSEFHSPHSGHLPSHLPDVYPQPWQTNDVFTGFTRCNRIYRMHHVNPEKSYKSCQQLFHILSRTPEHSALAAFHDWPLKQVRMFDHQSDQLTIAELIFSQSQFFVDGLTLTQQLSRLEIHLANQFR